jgi:hypothetical protein
MKHDDHHASSIEKIPLLGANLFLLMFYIFTWISLFRSSILKYNDFTVFYIAGRLARAGQFTHLFNYRIQLDLFKKLVSDPQNNLPYEQIFKAMMPEHPPFYTPVYTLIATDNYYTAYINYSLLILVILLVCGFIIFKFLTFSGWNKQNAMLASFSAVCFYPAAMILIKGHDMIFVLLGFLLWMTGLLLSQEKRAGIGLAMGTVAPQISGILALPLIASRRKAALWFFITCGALMLFSFLLIGIQGTKDFIDLFRVFMRGPDYINNQLNMFNFLGLIRRNFPGINDESASLVAWICAIIVVGGVCWYWWKKGKKLTAADIGLTVLLGLFFAPHLHFHNLSLLILPWLALATQWGLHGEKGQLAAIIFLTISSLLMLFGDLAPDPWRYLIAYLIMSILALILIISIKFSHHQTD